MAETLVKTCGITSAQDAAACCKLGAGLLGLVFAFSLRRVTIAQAREIRAAVPEARLVGVCVDEPIEALVALARQCRLDMLQLHGAESPEYCRDAGRRAGLPVVKAVRGGNDAELEAWRGLYGLLFDVEKGAAPQVEGLDALWSRAAAARERGHRVFLAGALGTGNVAAAVRRVQPYCVDVARGVERAPGVKDHDLVARFVEEVRGA